MQLEDYCSKTLLYWWLRVRIGLRRKWILACLPDCLLSDAIVPVVQVMIPGSRVSLVDSEQSIHNATSDYGLFYIGSGNSEGVLEPWMYRTGLRRRMIDSIKVGSLRSGPQIWWANFSARWLARSGRSDWIGFNGYFGFDMRGKFQARYWTRTFFLMIGSILEMVEGKKQGWIVAAILKDTYFKFLDRFLRKGDVSIVSVIAARCNWQHFDFGEDFSEYP